MSILKDILYKTRIEEVVGSTEVAIEKICFDSRAIEKGSLFVAVAGPQVDGHQYIDKGITLGAVAIICEKLPDEINDSITYVRVQDSSNIIAKTKCTIFENEMCHKKLNV